MPRPIAPLLTVICLLGGCAGAGDSGWNPLAWGRGSPPASLDPEGGYVTAQDARPPVAQILSAEWQPLSEGRLLVVRGLAPTKGHHSAELVGARPQPGDRLAADADGVLRLRFVASPPLPGSPQAMMPANPQTDQIVVARAFSHRQLDGLAAVQISGAGQVITLNR